MAGKHLQLDVLQTFGSAFIEAVASICSNAFAVQLTQYIHLSAAYINSQMVPYNYLRASCQDFRKITSVLPKDGNTNNVIKLQ